MSAFVLCIEYIRDMAWPYLQVLDVPGDIAFDIPGASRGCATGVLCRGRRGGEKGYRARSRFRNFAAHEQRCQSP